MFFVKSRRGRSQLDVYTHARKVASDIIIALSKDMGRCDEYFRAHMGGGHGMD